MAFTQFSQFTPAVLVHVSFAVSALVLGPIALTVRKGSRLHRTAGYLWVLLMLGTAVSSAFLRDFRLPNIAGFTPIHVVSVGVVVALIAALVFVVRRNIKVHRRIMWRTYLGGCIGAGAFALLPGRLLGDLVWHQWLALV